MKKNLMLLENNVSQSTQFLGLDFKMQSLNKAIKIGGFNNGCSIAQTFATRVRGKGVRQGSTIKGVRQGSTIAARIKVSLKTNGVCFSLIARGRVFETLQQRD